jgi:hypothetical protein
MPETTLVGNAQSYIDEQQGFGGAWHARIIAAWRRLQSSGVLQRRGLPHALKVVKADEAHVAATSAACAATRGLRVCALHTCGAQEVHASQFKRCSACSSVVYCSKEHQVQDWPAHCRNRT